MSKILSVVIAAYNVEKYIAQTLSSCLLEERYRNFYEVIVVNDGSIDGTKEIVQKYVDQYGTCFVLINKQNGGYGSAVNAGICAAQGKYIKLLDGDDWFDTDGLKKFIEKLWDINYDMILTDYRKVRMNGSYTVIDGREMRKNSVTQIDNIPKKQDFFSMHAICYKTEIFKKNKIRLTEQCFYTDSEYVLYPLIYIQTVIYFPINLYQYRIGVEGQSISREGIRRHLGDLKKVILQINSYFDSCGKALPENIENRISSTYKYYIDGIFEQEASQDMKKELMDFIYEIGEKYPKRFQYIRNRKIRLLAMSHGLLYRPCIMYMRYIEKTKRICK